MWRATGHMSVVESQSRWGLGRGAGTVMPVHVDVGPGRGHNDDR